LQLLEERGSELKGSESTAVEKVRLLYEACMNITAIEQRANTPLLHVSCNNCNLNNNSGNNICRSTVQRCPAAWQFLCWRSARLLMVTPDPFA